ncbi:MAG TPA: amino acid adenylation domain-containing protein, partial [Thermoanaerobaculia bacterium]
AGNGGSAGLAALPVQYADFAVWQRGWLQGEHLEEQLAYWRRELAAAPTVLDLPGDRPRPAVQSFRGATATSALPAPLVAALRALARSQGATLFMTLLAAFQLLLGRLSGQDDVLVGSPIANRGRSEIEGLIGFFANTLVFRARLAAASTFSALLAQVRETALGAYAHQDLPFERLVEDLAVERSLAHSPLFQALFLLAAPVPRLDLPGLRVEALESDGGSAKFDLNLALAETGDGLGAALEHSSDLFDRSTARRWIAHYTVLLERIVERSDERLDRLELLAPAERQQLLGEWNDTRLTLPDGGDLAAHVAVWAARTPAAAAVVRGDESLSYAELDRRANALAVRLCGLGVGPDAIVAICAGRSFAMTVGVLAVLKAGAAYLPLDPAYPPERLSFMLADSGAPVLLVQDEFLGLVPPYGGEVIRLDAALADAGRDEAPAVSVSPENLAYVLFTSGSTGRPKGVAMSRGALANLLSWQEREALVGGARTLQFASLSFDVSFQELLSTWWTGGTLVLVSEETRRDPQALLAVLSRQRVERVFLPFVALRHLVEAAELSRERLPLSLRDVVTAGEQLQVTAGVAGWLAELPGVRLHNQYGPTEAHVVTALTLKGDPYGWPALPSIGRPIGNLAIHLVDRDGRAVPIGVPGELLIGDAGLARGYLGRPELTAEKFVPDGFADEPSRGGARLYRTGDLARRTVSGEIEYLGRIDTQVKVRGFRIELGEVEAALSRLPGVKAAVVLARGEGSAKRLVAYVEPTGEREIVGAELRAQLAADLPAPAVPTAYVVLERLPVNPTG